MLQPQHTRLLLPLRRDDYLLLHKCEASILINTLPNGRHAERDYDAGTAPQVQPTLRGSPHADLASLASQLTKS